MANGMVNVNTGLESHLGSYLLAVAFNGALVKFYRFNFLIRFHSFSQYQ